MAISEKTAKLLWGRAGGMCSFPECKKRLDVEATEGDPAAIIGQMAHVVAHSPGGPRGTQVFRGTDIDGVENLILLCTEHHTRIDQQRNTYTPAWLYQAKEQHERWVRERLSPLERFRQAHEPTPNVSDSLHSTLLPVALIPLSIFSAPCDLKEAEIKSQIVYPPADSKVMWPFVCFNKQLVTFCDLGNPTGPFSRSIHPPSSQRVRSREWWRDPDLRRIYVMLLNRTLNKVTGRRGLPLDKKHQRYFFEPEERGKEREIFYHGLQGTTTSRLVVWQPKRKATGLPRNYWEHLAVSLQFHQMSDTSWCLSIRPERRFTIDGYQTLENKQIGRKATSRTSRIYNHDLLKEINFWRDFLSEGSPRIICSFGTQSLIIETELMHTTVTWPGIPEDSRPFRHTRYDEGLFSQADYQQALGSEIGESDEWETELGEWDVEEDG